MSKYDPKLLERWNCADNHIELINILRGLGWDSDVDVIFASIARLQLDTEDGSYEATRFIRSVMKNPFTMMPEHIWNGNFYEITGSIYFDCPVCDERGMKISLDSVDRCSVNYICYDCKSQFEKLEFSKFRIIHIPEKVAR